MSDKPSSPPPSSPDSLRREVEHKVDDLERRIDFVEQKLSERARAAREGRLWTDRATDTCDQGRPADVSKTDEPTSD